MTEENKKTEKEEEVHIVEEDGEDSSIAFDAIPHRMDKLKQHLDACRKEKQEYLEGWQRTKADLINYKKDEVKRAEEVAKFCAEEMIFDLLPVLDSFDMARKHAMQEEVRKGILLIRTQLEDVLRKRGIAVIEIHSGDIFDIYKHESAGEIESDFPEGKIAEEVQKGYTMHGKIIRASRVRLSKGKH